MGLLLSILVFSVGVLEVIACVRHIQYGYLPEWAPHHQVVASSTSGLARLREHWRKKPSRSADYDDKSNKSTSHITRSCDVQYSLKSSSDLCCGYSSNLDKCGLKLSGDSEVLNSCVRDNGEQIKVDNTKLVKCSERRNEFSDSSLGNSSDVVANRQVHDFTSSPVDEYNIKYQEYEEILSREANFKPTTQPYHTDNTTNVCRDETEDTLHSGAFEEISTPIDPKTGTKMKPKPLVLQNIVFEEYEPSFHEHRLSIDTLTPHSRSQSPTASPRRSKADICWPLFVLHSPISRRPSTPTTAEELAHLEDGGISPYFGGEMLTAEHIRSTNRPLSVPSETYHADQDIVPVFVGKNVPVEDIKSVHRPLTVSTRTDEEGLPKPGGSGADDSTDGQIQSTQLLTKSVEVNAAGSLRVPTRTDEECSLKSDSDDFTDSQLCGTHPPTNNVTANVACSPSQQLQSANYVVEMHYIDKNSLLTTGGAAVEDDGVMSPSEEAKAQEACINQKRRTSETNYLSHNEQVVAVPLKEAPPEPLFAIEKEEPTHLKPAKAASFEEARLESFRTKPQFAGVTPVQHDGARRTSLLTDIEKLDAVGLRVTDKSDMDESSAVVGRIEIKAAKDPQQFPINSTDDVKLAATLPKTSPSIVNNEDITDNSTPSTLLKKSGTNENENRSVVFDSSSCDLLRERTKSQFDDEEEHKSELTVPIIQITTEMYDRQTLVEVTAIKFVDKLIDDAVEKIKSCMVLQVAIGGIICMAEGKESPRPGEEILKQEKINDKYTKESTPEAEETSAQREVILKTEEPTKIKEEKVEKLLDDSNAIKNEHSVPSVSTQDDEKNTPASASFNQQTVVEAASTVVQETSPVPEKESSNITAAVASKSDENVAERSSTTTQEELVQDTDTKPSESEVLQKTKSVESTLVESKSTDVAITKDKQSAVDNTSEQSKVTKLQDSNSKEIEKVAESKSPKITKEIVSSNQTQIEPSSTKDITALHVTESESNKEITKPESTQDTHVDEVSSKDSKLKESKCNIDKSKESKSVPTSEVDESTSTKITQPQECKPTSHTTQGNSSSCDEALHTAKEIEDTKLSDSKSTENSKTVESNYTIVTKSEESKGFKDAKPNEPKSTATDEREPAEDSKPVRAAGAEDADSSSSQQQAGPEAFWLIFSGEYTKAMSKDWHSGHFCCWQCDESLTGQRYVLRDDHPYCIKCYESVFANMCEECNKTIGIDSKDLSYKDKHWHEACFLCTKCRVSLVDKQFGSKADKIYCGNCYDAQFASRCDGCGEIFRAGTKKMEYKTRQWHEKCFCCVVCKSAIGTKSFIPREQEIYCATCYEEKFATRCVKCNKIITSGGVTYKNEPWHRECFTCTNCNTSLAGQRFTSRDEKPYCAECFGELFAKRCTACSKPITGIGGTRFISFEDRHWHNDCFICASCKTSLVGRGFITDADDIICPECAKQKLM